MSHMQVPQNDQRMRVQFADSPFSPGDLVKVHESRYKRALYQDEYGTSLMGIVLRRGDSRHYYRVLLFVRHYHTGELIVSTHYRNIELYE